MKKILISGVLMMASIVSVLAAGPTSTATAPAKITIISPLTITKNVDMDFGTVAISTTAASIQLSPASSASPNITGTANILAATSATAAKFTITGLGNSAFNINVPTPISVTDNGGNGGTAMPLTLTCSESGTAPSYTSALVSGTKVIYVGGTLSIGANQTASTYQGTITVNVNYN